MHVHVLQHVPFEGLGSIEDWLSARQVPVTYTRLFESPRFPAVSDVDFLIALGGPMSVNDEDRFSWLRPEKAFIREAILRGKKVLGICLGAQLIADAMGAPVHAGREKEIGWFPIFAESPRPETFAFPVEADVFHWHGETFELPAGAIRLATSAACRNQAFQIGRHVIGLQFHLETTPDSAAALIANCGEELVTGRYVQPIARLRAVPPAAYASINGLMGDVLDYLVDGEQPLRRTSAGKP